MEVCPTGAPWVGRTPVPPCKGYGHLMHNGDRGSHRSPRLPRRIPGGSVVHRRRHPRSILQGGSRSAAKARAPGLGDHQVAKWWPRSDASTRRRSTPALLGFSKLFLVAPNERRDEVARQLIGRRLCASLSNPPCAVQRTAPARPCTGAFRQRTQTVARGLAAVGSRRREYEPGHASRQHHGLACAAMPRCSAAMASNCCAI